MKKGQFNGVEVEASGSIGHKVDKHPMLERKSKLIPEDCKRRQEAQIKPKTGIIIGPFERFLIASVFLKRGSKAACVLRKPGSADLQPGRRQYAMQFAAL